MSREIKFRAWNKVFKKFYEVKAIYFDGDMVGIKTGEEVDGEWTVVKREHIDLVENTGLIDIKGNQIFNAYLIKDDENFIWEVIYKQGAFYAKCDDLMAEQLLSSVNLFGVVIGNIYEHSHLLEV